jgi:carboxylesterase
VPHSTNSFSFVPSGVSRGQIVLFHGFSGSPWELFPLGKSLSAHGYFVEGPLLPGHGKSPEDLLFVDWFSWLRAAEIELLKHAQPVIVGGLSMGALLSLILAERHPNRVKALVLLAPVVALKGAGGILKKFQHVDLRGLVPRWVHKKFPDIENIEVRNGAPCLPRYPLQRVFDLMTLQDMAAQAVPNIQCPSFIVGAKNDHVVPIEAIEKLHRHLAQSKMLTLQRGFHIIPRDHDAALAAEKIAAFVDETS